MGMVVLAIYTFRQYH